MASSGTTSNTMRFTGAQLVVHLLERRGYHYGQRHSGRLHPAYLRCLKPEHADPPHPRRAMSRARALSPGGWRVPKASRRSVWPAAARGRRTGDGDRRCPPWIRFRWSASPAGTGLDDRYRRLPRKWTPTASLSPSPNITIWCATLPSCRR